MTYVDFPFLFSHVSRGRAGRDGDGNGNGDCDCECCSELWNDDGLHLSEGAYEALGRHLAPFVFEILDGTSLRMDDGSPRYPSPAILVGFFCFGCPETGGLLGPLVHIAQGTQQLWAPLSFCAMTSHLQELPRHTVMNGILHH